MLADSISELAAIAIRTGATAAAASITTIVFAAAVAVVRSPLTGADSDENTEPPVSSAFADTNCSVDTSSKAENSIVSFHVVLPP